MTGLSQAELKPFAEMAERFAKKELAPRAIDLDNYPFAPFNAAAISAAESAGLFGMTLPEKLGGVGQGMEALCEALFPLARRTPVSPPVLLADSFARALLAAGGREDAAQSLGRGKIGVTSTIPARPAARADRRRRPGRPGPQRQGRICRAGPRREALILPGPRPGWEARPLSGGRRRRGRDISPPVPSLGLRGCPVADVTLTKVRGDARMALPADYPAIAAKYLAAAAALAAGVSEGSFARPSSTRPSAIRAGG